MGSLLGHEWRTSKRKAQPDSPLIDTIDTQLDAMERWTAAGREPAEDERKTISIGLIAVRELSTSSSGGTTPNWQRWTAKILVSTSRMTDCRRNVQIQRLERMVKALLIQSKSIFHVVLRDALARTEQMAQIDSTWNLPGVVRRQLEFMRECVSESRSPLPDEIERVDIGPIAVQNFENSDEEYATWLKELDYAFRNWASLL